MPTSNPAVNKYSPAIANHPSISATGVKGFLVWMKSDPVMAHVYRQIQPQVNELLGAKSPGLSGRRQLGAMGCCSCFDAGVYCCAGPGAYCCAGAGAYCCAMSSSDSTIAAAPSNATNSAGLVNSLSNIISMGASVALTANQIHTANQMTTAQLQRAAAGLPPLNFSVGGVATSGVPSRFAFMGGTLFGLPTWAVLGAGVVLVVVASKK
ncbi:MAG: hypothetical protein ACRETA_14155 [Gammaproteobacteria bacterium]